MKIVETTGFSIQFQLKEIERSPLFSFEKFNYGGGSFYQKYKNHVSQDFFETLKSFKDFDIRLMDGQSNHFKFILVGDINIETVNMIAENILKFTKEIHKSLENVELSIVRHFCAEETIIFKTI